MTKINNLNNINKAKISGKDIVMNLSDSLKKTVETLKSRIEKEIPDKGYFRDFAEDFANPNKDIYAKAVSLSIKKDINNDGKAYLVVNILHPKMMLNASSIEAYGTRNDLLKELNDANIIKRLEDSIKNLSERMKEDY